MTGFFRVDGFYILHNLVISLFHDTFHNFQDVESAGMNLPGTSSVDDKATRRSIYKNFKKYAEVVAEINHDDTLPFTTEINRFSVEPLSDLERHFGLNNSNSEEEIDFTDLPEETEIERRSVEELPESVDWRDTLFPPEHQDRCGSCWSFSSVSSVEAAYYRATGEKKKFSYQELVDCVFERKRYGNGCTGASISTGILFIVRSRHLAGREDYTYVAKDGLCKQRTTPNRLTNVALRRLYRVPKTATGLMSAVVEGVVSVGVKAGRSLLAYKSGIYYDPYTCKSTSYPNHAVNLVGYGEEAGKKYWLVRNSWGADWGEKGYYRLSRDHNNHCKIHETALRLDLRCLNKEKCEEQKRANQEKQNSDNNLVE